MNEISTGTFLHAPLASSSSDDWRWWITFAWWGGGSGVGDDVICGERVHQEERKIQKGWARVWTRVRKISEIYKKNKEISSRYLRKDLNFDWNFFKISAFEFSVFWLKFLQDECFWIFCFFGWIFCFFLLNFLVCFLLESSVQQKKMDTSLQILNLQETQMTLDSSTRKKPT